VVCWTASEEGRPASAGLALVHENLIAKGAWQRFLDDVRQSGARRV
jgi:hypothetical protein